MTGKILSDRLIRELIRNGSVLNANPKNVNPSSLDLRLSNEKWKTMGSFLPLVGQKIRESLGSHHIVDTENCKREEFYMERDQPYVIRLVESLNLPKGITARVFNKSGCGRVGISVKGLVDGVPRFSYVPSGYVGEIYTEVCSTTFQCVFKPGETSAPQIRFYDGEPGSVSGAYLSLLLQQHPILVNDQGERSYSDADLEEIISTGKMIFTIDLSSRTLAYTSRRTSRTFNLSKRDYYDPNDFFSEEVSRGEKSIVINPGDFAIVKSQQNIRLPPNYAAEIAPYSADIGDIKTSYADLVNAGHGFDENDPNVKGHIFFEVRARDTPIVLQDGQPLAKFELYEMLEEPRQRYMHTRTSNFNNLSSFLPKQFKK